MLVFLSSLLLKVFVALSKYSMTLKKSLFFGTMCNRCNSANITAGGSTEPRLSIHTNMDMRILLPWHSQHAQVLAYRCSTLPGFKCEQITRNFFRSQQMLIEQFLPRTLKELFTIHKMKVAATTIAKRRCLGHGCVANTRWPSVVSVTSSSFDDVNSCMLRTDQQWSFLPRNFRILVLVMSVHRLRSLAAPQARTAHSTSASRVELFPFWEI